MVAETLAFTRFRDQLTKCWYLVMAFFGQKARRGKYAMPWHTNDEASG